MALRLDLFCEDVGHEAFARAAVERLANDAEIEVSIRVASARAGLGRAQRELRAYTYLVRRQAGAPDALIVLADGNDVGPQARRDEIEQMGLDQVFPVSVIGTPDPCVEAWLLADPQSLEMQFGLPLKLKSPRLRGSEDLKRCLRSYLQDAGKVVMEGGVEFADEIVGTMSLYRAGKTEPTLKRFIDDLRVALK